VYDFLTHIQQQISAEPDGRDEAPAKLKNEERTIPEIIFNVEDFEKHLIQITSYGKQITSDSAGFDSNV